MANDIRTDDITKFAASKNFDALSFPSRLVPYRSYEAGNDTVARKMGNFLYASGKLFGLGEQTSPLRPQIFYKDTFTDGTWSTTANNVVLTTPPSFLYDTFVQYKGFIFGFILNTSIWKYDITGAAAMVTADGTVGSTITSTANGVVHSKDDILYMAFNNVIVSKNGAGGAWNVAALTLPTKYTITSLCEYGNYLAIACKDTDVLSQSSRVFLWDRDSSVATLAESIDWGLGTLQVLEELEGRLIGISLIKRETSGGLVFNSILSFKYYAGAQGAIEFARIDGSRDASISPLSSLGVQKQKANNRIYFAVVLTMNEGSGSKEGVWSVGRSGQDRPYAITVEHQSSDGTVPTAIDGFFLAGSYVFIAYSNTGSLSGNISKSNDAATFSNNSQYESLIFDGGDPSQTKKLIGVTVMTAPMPAAGSVALGYAIDSTIGTTTTFTNIFTNTTDNDISHSAINIESSGATLPEFKEVQFQIISTGGAVVTGLSFEYELVPKRIY